MRHGQGEYTYPDLDQLIEAKADLDQLNEANSKNMILNENDL